MRPVKEDRPYQGSGSPCLAYLTVTRLPAVKWSTQKDLYQALIRGRTVITRRFADQNVLDEAREAAAISSYHFQRLFKALFLESPHAYRTRQRMDLARKLLTETNLAIKEIARKCGYESPATFTRKVRKELGNNPNEIRNFGQSCLR